MRELIEQILPVLKELKLSADDFYSITCSDIIQFQGFFKAYVNLKLESSTLMRSTDSNGFLNYEGAIEDVNVRVVLTDGGHV